jgi:hypothetical protein
LISGGVVVQILNHAPQKRLDKKKLEPLIAAIDALAIPSPSKVIK